MADVGRQSAAPLRARPLSPHLQVFRPILTMMMSIAHRITGGALYFGTILLAWFLIAAAGSARSFATASWFLSSPVGELVLLGFTWALFHHLFGGIRHAIWDTGHGYTSPLREWLSAATLIGSLLFTLIVWAIALVAL
jgi:succinate dehydrogenase / fumarate reductase, cytochrome b subunit